MSAGKPIVAMMNGEGPAVIAEASCGDSVPAGNSKEFAALIKRMQALSATELETMGARGKAYCSEHFSFGKAIMTIEDLMNQINSK